MSEEKPITKSFLEQKIHEKAVEHWKSDVQRAFSSFKNPLFKKLIIGRGFNKELGCMNPTLQDLSGKYEYEKQETFLRFICTNYEETKKETIKNYEQDNTDIILDSLSSLGDYLNDNRRY